MRDTRDDAVAILRSGRIPVGGVAISPGAAFDSVFSTLPQFPETPAHSWREPDGPGDRFDYRARFLGYPASPLEFVFVAGRLDRILSSDPEDVADGWNDAASAKRVDALTEDWTRRLGPPTRTFRAGSDRSATWRFGEMEMSVFYETRTPSVGFCARRALPPQHP